MTYAPSSHSVKLCEFQKSRDSIVHQAFISTIFMGSLDQGGGNSGRNRGNNNNKEGCHKNNMEKGVEQ